MKNEKIIKTKCVKLFKQSSTLMLVFTLISFQTIANAETFASVSHIHHLKVYKDKVLLGISRGSI
jgi:hypothetical protein